MPPRFSLTGTAGSYLLRAAYRAQRRALGARVELHRDARGRTTPCLVLGRPRLGTLVFLHGFGDQTDNFLTTAARLRDDYRILVPAMPGFGDGWVDPAEQHSFQAYGRWLGDVIASIAPRTPVHLMGNSLGGATALAIAGARPELLSSLILVNSAGIHVEDVPSINHEVRDGQLLFEIRDREASRRFDERVFVKQPRLPALIKEHLYQEQLRRADWHARLLVELNSEGDPMFTRGCMVDLDAIDVPTLVVWGDRDTLFPLDLGQHAAACIPGAQMSVIEGVGHCPHIEAPRALAGAFRGFAAALSREAGRSGDSARAASPTPELPRKRAEKT